MNSRDEQRLNCGPLLSIDKRPFWFYVSQIPHTFAKFEMADSVETVTKYQFSIYNFFYCYLSSIDLQKNVA